MTNPNDLTNRLVSKGTVFVLIFVAASTALISGSREWVTGSVSDVAVGASALHGRGSDIAPGVMAAALVGLASAVVAATSGRVLRVVAAWVALLAAVLGMAVVISVLVDPGAALGRLATAGTGRSGALAAHGRAGGWTWAALAAMVLMGVGGFLALAAGSRWHGLSSRYDAGEPSNQSAQSTQSTGQASAASAWDQLSRGEDPTDGR